MPEICCSSGDALIKMGLSIVLESSCHFSVVANERMLSPTTLYELLIN